MQCHEKNSHRLPTHGCMASLLPANGVLGKKLAGHLLRRCTFGPSRADIDQFATKNIGHAVDELMGPAPKPTPPVNPFTGQVWVDPAQGKFKMDGDFGENFNKDHYVIAWWMAQMFQSGNNITEKMIFFWHTHFTNIISRMRDVTAVYYQLELFRFYVLGNYKTLARKICYDNAMLRFLDGNLNVRGRPQENFAREFFELYTVGKGTQVGSGDYTTFTEQDVQEGARVLSGWGEDLTFENLDPETGIPMGSVKTNQAGLMATQHDAGTKTFSTRFQGRTIAPATVTNNLTTVAETEQELSDFVDMVFEQEATARHICRKLYRFFVYYHITPEVENDIIGPLATLLRNNQFEIKPVLATLLKSQHFYDMDNDLLRDNQVGAIIKSPLELMLSAMRFFKVAMPDPDTQADQLLSGAYEKLIGFMGDQGLNFLEPFDVAGYDAYHQAPVFNRNWISSNYLAQRYKFADHFIEGSGDPMEPYTFQVDMMQYVENRALVTNPRNAEETVREIVNYFLPKETSPERFDYFLRAVLLDNLSAINWGFEWDSYVQTGDATAVKGQFNNLVRALMQSPESQLQ